MRTWPDDWERLRRGDGCPMEFPPPKEPLLPEAQYEADVRALRELTSRP